MRVFVIHSVSDATRLVEAVPFSDESFAESLVGLADDSMPMLFGEAELKSAVEQGDIVRLKDEEGENADFVFASSSLEKSKAIQEIENFLDVRDYTFSGEGTLADKLVAIFAGSDFPYQPMDGPEGRTFAGVSLCPVKDGEDIGDLGPDDVSDTRTVSIQGDGPIGFFYKREGRKVGLLYLQKEKEGEEVTYALDTFVEREESIARAIANANSARTRVLPEFTLSFKDSPPATEEIYVASDEATEEDGPLSLTIDEVENGDENEIMEAIERVNISEWMPSTTYEEENDSGNKVERDHSIVANVEVIDSPEEALVGEKQQVVKVPPIITAGLASTSKGGSWTKGRDPLVLDRAKMVGVVILEDIYSSSEVDNFAPSLPNEEPRRHKDAEGGGEFTGMTSDGDGTGGGTSGSTNKPLSGFTFCCTGRFEEMDNRDEVESYIVSNGGGFKESMSSKVDVLIKGDISPQSSTGKLDFAQENNLPVVSIHAVIDVVKGQKSTNEAFSA